MPASDGSDSVVEKEMLGLRSTREVSNVVLTEGCVIVDYHCTVAWSRSSWIEVLDADSVMKAALMEWFN